MIQINAQVNLKKFNKHSHLLSTHIRLSVSPLPHPPPWEGTYLNTAVFVRKYGITSKQMLIWETASMCVLLGGESNKATAVFLSSPNFLSTHIRLSLGGHLFEYCSIC